METKVFKFRNPKNELSKVCDMSYIRRKAVKMTEVEFNDLNKHRDTKICVLGRVEGKHYKEYSILSVIWSNNVARFRLVRNLNEKGYVCNDKK